MDRILAQLTLAFAQNGLISIDNHENVGIKEMKYRSFVFKGS